jgi:nucleotide-binding universal stress UspA family protein
MSTVLAALDNSPTAGSVLAVARQLGRVFGASVQELRVVRGDVVEQIVEAGSSEDVVAVAIGARSRPADGHPLGSTAIGVATGLAKPIAVVPPGAKPPTGLRRALVPLEGTTPTSVAPRFLVELAPDAGLEVVALHVLEPDSLPAFTDQPQHEQLAWAGEFLYRYCPWGIGAVHLMTRVGHVHELVPVAARESGADLVVLGWAQELTGGHARVVRAVLEEVSVPVVLVPIVPAVAVGRGDTASGALSSSP